MNAITIFSKGVFVAYQKMWEEYTWWKFMLEFFSRLQVYLLFAILFYIAMK